MRQPGRQLQEAGQAEQRWQTSRQYPRRQCITSINPDLLIPEAEAPI
jgi:hypothetical protein